MAPLIVRNLPVLGRAVVRTCRSSRNHTTAGIAMRNAAPCSNLVPRFSGSTDKPMFGNQIRMFSSHKLKCPELGGESITEGTLMEWSKKVGESVKKGEVIALIETDKVTIDVTADRDGHLAQVLVQPDENCEVGQAIAVIGEGAGTGAAAPAAPAASAPVSHADPVTIAVTDMGGESITEGTVMPFNFKVGDYVKAGEVIVGIETDKVTVDITAEQGGTIKELLAEPDSTAEVGTQLCVIVPGPEPSGAAAASSPPATAAPAEKKAAPKPAAAAAAGGRVDRREKMPRMRQAIARNLKNCQTEMAMLTTFQEVNMAPVMALRKEYKEMFEEKHGARFGFMSVFMKASANVLMQIPSVNAYIDASRDEIVYRDYVDIAFAAATPKGLVTPVCRNVESMSILQIERAFAELVGKAKKDKVSLDEMSNMSFTISNGGVFGSMLGTPLIGSLNQAAILGLHATKMRPVVLKSGEIAVRPVMYVALTYDHRLVDGREAVTFLDMLKQQMEDPRRLLLEL